MEDICIIICYSPTKNAVFPIDNNKKTFIINYDPKNLYVTDNAMFRIGQKWENILWFLKNTNEWKKYNYLWFPDEDLRTTVSDIDAFCNLVIKNKLELCQPSLVKNNYVAHQSLICKNSTIPIRKNNFIEVQMPCFNKSFINKYLIKFLEENKNMISSAWGIDLWWSSYFKNKLYVIDAIQIEHTKSITSNKLCREQKKYFEKKYKLNKMFT